MEQRGAVVQLGEHHTGSVDVRGSSPLSSTIFHPSVSGLMSHLLEFRSFSFSRIISGSTPGCRSALTSVPLYVLLLACLFALGCSTADAAKDAQKFTRPQVLVLVMGGFGSSQMCSINYDRVVELEKAQSDLDAIAAAGNWEVRDARGETKASGGPRPTPTTSISFAAKGLIDQANGTLPLEPFLVGLKRFKYIEVDYITPSQFVFQGLKDFENEFVKIDLRQSGNSYRYRVVVKDGDFEKLNLPSRELEKPKAEQPQPSGGRRIALAIGLAVVAALVVYIVMAYMAKRR